MVRSYNLVTPEFNVMAPDQLVTVLNDHDLLVWVDCYRPDVRELSWLSDVLMLPQALANTVKGNNLFKSLVWEGDVGGLTLNGVRFDHDHGEVELETLTIIMSTRWMVTIHTGVDRFVEQLQTQWEMCRLGERPLVYSMFVAVDSVLDGYILAANDIANELESLRPEAVAGRSRSLRRLFKLRRQLYRIVKAMRPYRLAFHALLREISGASPLPVERRHTFYRQLIAHQHSARQEVAATLSMLDGIVQEYQTRQSNELNAMVMWLTVVVLVLTTWSVVAGFYTSIDDAGELLRIITILTVVTIAELVFMKRQGWLRTRWTRTYED
jgi:Mg2+ and Co2+ transporter CorA